MPTSDIRQTNWRHAFARRAVLLGLRQLQHGHLVWRDGDGVTHFPDGKDWKTLPADGVAEVHVRDSRFYRAMLTGGSLGVAEAYVQGWWDSPRLVDVLRLAIRNADWLARLGGQVQRWANLPARFFHLLRGNSRRGSRRNITDHYDLSNAFFQLWLDRSMTYSSALFESETQTLEEAQITKLDRLARLLQLSPQDHLLEIGTGWGGLAIHFARHYGARVTTTTISEQQYALAKQRIQEAGLESRITLLRQDYRDLRGEYDKLVSVEMIEAVGHRYLPQFFAQCSRLLKPQGLMAIQAITIPDQRYAAYLRGVDFIQKFVFPGGCLPSLGAMQAAVRQNTDMRMVSQHDFPEHYARTLQIWSQRFEAHLAEVRELIPAERFTRIWRYYLAYCEVGFREHWIGLSQLIWAKPGFRGTLPVVSIGSP